MNRRTFLGAGALLARRSNAGLIEAGGPAGRHRIATAKWFVYKTGRMRRNYWRPDVQEPVFGLALRLTTDRGAEGMWADETRIQGVKAGRGHLPVLDYASTRGGTEATVQLDIGQAQERVAALLAGRSPAATEENWKHLNTSAVPLEIVTMTDLALWDLCGRIAGKPAYELIGQKREDIKVYIDSMPNLPEPAAWAQHAVACKKRGYHGYKIHPYIRFDPVRRQPIDEYRGFPDHDLAACRAVRDAVGPDFPLMLDNAWTYTYEQAVRVGRALDGLGFHWLESPMREDDGHVDSYARLARAIRTPLCAPQAGDGAHMGRLRWIERAACKVCRGDVYAPGGGITSCLILAEACARAGIRLDLHAWGPVIYNLYALAAIPESVAEFQESFDADPAASLRNAGKLTARSMAAVQFSSYEPDARGRVRFPTAPGTGIRVNWDFIDSHAWTA